MTVFADVIDALHRPACYEYLDVGRSTVDELLIEHHETHISHIFLVGDLALKIKKPVRTGFLDYSTIEKRRHFCQQEFQLDRRYTTGLYLGVVSITTDEGRIRVDGTGQVIEYAVKMRRFEQDALLVRRVETGQVRTTDIRAIAERIADFHRVAERGSVERSQRACQFVSRNFTDVVQTLKRTTDRTWTDQIEDLSAWADAFLQSHPSALIDRGRGGFIRACHGDLHLANLLFWNGHYSPFDGIEFNEDLRWIDVASDTAFLTMDLAAHEREDLSNLLRSHYLEGTGDYAALKVMRWYVVYRALIRAMVAAIRVRQSGGEAEVRRDAAQEIEQHLKIARSSIESKPASLTITHGLSGSGKTYASERLVLQTGAVRLRSDIERKRQLECEPSKISSSTSLDELYEVSTRNETYQHMAAVAEQIIGNGYSVILDATFLQRSHRDDIRRVAARLNVPFKILACHADPQVLKKRIQRRSAKGHDASDADVKVLEQQIVTQEELCDAERSAVIDLPRHDSGSTA